MTSENHAWRAETDPPVPRYGRVVFVIAFLLVRGAILLGLRLVELRRWRSREERGDGRGRGGRGGDAELVLAA